MERELAPLPAPMASIIGRESEIATVRGLLEEEEIRLVTLTGPAGVGKTRLALEVARECRSVFGDRVSFISLADLTDTSALLSHIASALGVADSVEPIAGIRRQLRESTRLLVLDNLEQLPGAGIELASLLKAVARLTVLATSQSRLDLYGEYRFPVDPLPLPSPGIGFEGLSANPAIRLLVDGARSENASLVLPPSAFPLLAEIAIRVDGIPLALELAGASIPQLGVRGVLDHVGEAMSLMGTSLADVPERLQTMPHAIARSYNLLSEQERALFRRLCVFTSGFTFEMAKALANGWQADDGYPLLFGLPMPKAWMSLGKEGPVLVQGGWSPPELPPLDISPLLGIDSLVRQNLVRTILSESGIDRYELLVTIREFGLEQLEVHGESEAARHAHAALMLSIAELCSMTLWGYEWRPAVAWVEAELPNIRAAVSWTETQPPEANQISLRIVEALWPFWQSRGYASEGCRHLETVLKNPGGTPAARAAALNLLGALSWIRNDLDRATSALDEGLSLAQQIPGYDVGLGRNFLFRALVAWNQRDFERVERMALISKQHFTVAADDLGLPTSVLILGVAARAKGDLARANEWFTLAHHGFMNHESGGFIWGAGVAQYYLGVIARETGDRVRAVSNLRAALELLLDIGDPWTVGGCVGTLATYFVEDDELEEAARLLGAANAFESSSGVFLPPTETATHEAAARDVEQRIGPDAFVQCFAEGQAWSMETAGAHARRAALESAPERAARLIRPSVPEREIPRLSAHHMRTLQLKVDGLSIKEIAREEGKASPSIYERFDRIKEHLGLPPNSSIADVVGLAVSLGIVEPRRLPPPSRRP